MNGSNGNNNNNMALKEYVNEEGKTSRGYEFTPLTIAARYEHFQIVKYLIEQCEADPNIADSDGWNALHLAAGNNKKDTELIELLLTNMSLTSINKKDRWGDTPLDYAYRNKGFSGLLDMYAIIIRSSSFINLRNNSIFSDLIALCKSFKSPLPFPKCLPFAS